MRELQKRISRSTWCVIAIALFAEACATAGRDGPSIAVLPGGGKSMSEFNADDITCRTTARARSTDRGPPPAAMGLSSEPALVASRGRIALRPETDTGTGSIFGGALAPASDNSFTPQQRYDTAYLQCMHSKGHKIPVSDAMSS